MKRREFSLACASAVAAAPFAMAATGTAQAQARKFEDGADFISLDKKVATESPPGKIEVIEFFWYSCPHCNAFEPKLETWIRKLPADVVMRRVPTPVRRGRA